MVRDLTHRMEVCLVSSLMTLSLGRNPRNGGSPPRENKLRKTLILFIWE